MSDEIHRITNTLTVWVEDGGFVIASGMKPEMPLSYHNLTRDEARALRDKINEFLGEG